VINVSADATRGTATQLATIAAATIPDLKRMHTPSHGDVRAHAGSAPEA
jgi:hypothetical protein